jgi:hypothetical protein
MWSDIGGDHWGAVNAATAPSPPCRRCVKLFIDEKKKFNRVLMVLIIDLYQGIRQIGAVESNSE